MNLADFEAGVATRIQDTSDKLSLADRDALISQAVKQRYSKDRPRELVTDISGNGTSLLNLPAGPSDPPEAFEDGFSEIREIEWPVGEVPPTFIDQHYWQLYRAPTGLKIMLWSTPSAADLLRVTWTVRHMPGTSGQSPVATTVPDCDFEAVCDYAAFLCCQALAGRYSQTNDSTIQADAVSYRTKAQEYLALGKELKKRYDEHIGIQEDSTGGGSSTKAAIAIGDVDNKLGAGVDRLTHRRR